MALEQTWRWYGPNDPITLKEIRQTGATGIVTALHHIPIGEVWSIEEIMKRKQMIEADGLTWSVVESLPVHENINKEKGNYKQLIEQYKTSVQNLGKCGINIICYNFMPVLDWSRTDLTVLFHDGSITTKFEMKALVAFDLFVLKRSQGEQIYSDGMLNAAKQYYENLNTQQKEKLSHDVLLGLPGSGDTYSPNALQEALDEYRNVGESELREHLFSFLREIIPTAEESGVLMAIHPDDPPRPLFGLPRIVRNKRDL